MRLTHINGTMITNNLCRRLAFLLLTFALLLSLCACSAPEKPTVSPAPQEDYVDFSPQGTAPVPTNQPDEIPVLDDLPVYFRTRVQDTPLRAEPSHEAEAADYLLKGTKVELLEESGNYLFVRLDDGRELWTHRWYLEAEDPQRESRRQEEYLNLLTSTPGFTSIEPTEYTSTASFLNCRELPMLECEVLCMIPRGTKAQVLGSEGDFYLCRLEDGSLVYCSKLYMTDGSAFANVPGATDLRKLLPQAEFELLFTTGENIAGYSLYPAVPIMENTTASLLKAAFDIFYEDGYIIKIYDAYRPKSAQYILYDILPDYRYLANPYVGNSWHQLGRAVDMSLVNAETGEELEMPTEMHAFRREASRHKADEWTEEARKNVEYMTSVMESVGFSTIDTEWWHFEYLGRGGYLDPNIDLNKIDYSYS